MLVAEGRPVPCETCPEKAGLLQPGTVRAWNLYHDLKNFGWDVVTALADLVVTPEEAELLLEQLRMIEAFYRRMDERRQWQLKKDMERGTVSQQG